jgi:hypothetical protein
MSHAIRVALVCAALAPIVSTRIALAAGATGLHSGGTLQWAGYQHQVGAPPAPSNVNEIEMSPGSNAMINGVVEVPIAFPCIETKAIAGVGPFCNLPTFCADSPGGQLANKSYYIYYAAYLALGVTRYAPVISLTPPGAEGAPSGNIQFTIAPNPQTTTLAAVFLGSYLTDAAGDLIPFERMGAEVILIPKLVAGAPFSQLAYAFAAPANAATHAFRQMPASAAGLIVDIAVTPQKSVGGAIPGAADLYVLDPVFNAFAGGPNSQHHIWVPAGTASVQYDHQWIKTLPGNTNITLDLPVNPVVLGTSYNVTLDLVGYVEPVSHLF